MLQHRFSLFTKLPVLAMKNLVLAFFALVISVASQAQTAKKTMPGIVTSTVMTDQSVIKWTGKKVLGSHAGQLKVQSGNIDMRSSNSWGGKIVVDMQSINCTDLEGDSKGQLEGHLKADDFFGVANFPTSTINVISTTSKGGNNYMVTANLTIKGITEKISFPATIEVSTENLTVAAKLSIDRTKFGIKYGSSSFFDKLGDKAIENNFDLEVNLVAKKQVMEAAISTPAVKGSKKTTKKAKTH
jgi:polyisoprenoid-binding protein YceI